MNVATALDPRAFHLFEFRGRHLLYDLNTGTVSDLSPFASDCLRLLSTNGWEKALVDLRRSYPGITRAEIEACIVPLQDRGFFQFLGISREHQRRQLDLLWKHRPRAIQLFVAQNCNLQCRYCYAACNGSNQKRRLMSFEMARSAVDYLVLRSGRRKHLSITFFGGEPLMNFDCIVETVKYCMQLSRKRRKDFDFSVSTNATLLDEPKRRFIADHRFTMLISIDGYREMHNWQRPFGHGGGSFDVAIENAMRMLELWGTKGQTWRIKARANLTSRFHDADKVIAALESNGFTTIGLSAIYPHCGDDYGGVAITDEQWERLDDYYDRTMDVVMECLKRGDSLPPYARRWLGKSFENISKPIGTLGLRCGVGRNTNAVDCDGNLFPCHRYVGLDSYIIGDIFHGLDHDRTMRYYRACNETAFEACQACWLRSVCAGSCPWERSSPQQGVLPPDPGNCQRLTRAIERGIWLYHEIQRQYPETFDEIRKHYPGRDASPDMSILKSGEVI
jgi:uncharacterized protein